MCRDFSFSKRVKLNLSGLYFIQAFFVVCSPIRSYALQKTLPDYQTETVVTASPLLAKNTTEFYQTILQETEKESLWFDTVGLTLSGRSLHRLLADLGWQDVNKFNHSSITDYQQYDQRLTSKFLELINLKNQRTLLPLENALSQLITAIKNDTTDHLLVSLLPEYDQVSHLRKAISEYRLLAAYPWPVLDIDFQPRLGQSHLQVKSIREILVKLGDLPQKMQTKYRIDVFDLVVVGALKKFQRRHGLLVDGKLGVNTYEALQITPQQRIKQLQINLWRWFMLPSPPDKYLLVNIPSYQLSIIENGKHRLQMKVIVGGIDNQTPQLVTEINRVTLNPTWTPTVNIIKNELLPEYQQDFLSLKRKNFQLVKGPWNDLRRREIDSPKLNLAKLLQTYRLVQAPGDNNALGYYRFNIPNRHSVYLHDTPVKSLFKQQYRALSHGCVRLENANLLAEYLLSNDPSYNENTIHSALESGKTKHLRLNFPLPVYITYQTVWLDLHGELHFSSDIYNLDNNVT